MCRTEQVYFSGLTLLICFVKCLVFYWIVLLYRALSTHTTEASKTTPTITVNRGFAEPFAWTVCMYVASMHACICNREEAGFEPATTHTASEHLEEPGSSSHNTAPYNTGSIRDKTIFTHLWSEQPKRLLVEKWTPMWWMAAFYHTAPYTIFCIYHVNYLRKD